MKSLTRLCVCMCVCVCVCVCVSVGVYVCVCLSVRAYFPSPLLKGGGWPKFGCAEGTGPGKFSLKGGGLVKKGGASKKGGAWHFLTHMFSHMIFPIFIFHVLTFSFKSIFVFMASIRQSQIFRCAKRKIFGASRHFRQNLAWFGLTQAQNLSVCVCKCLYMSVHLSLHEVTEGKHIICNWILYVWKFFGRGGAEKIFP